MKRLNFFKIKRNKQKRRGKQGELELHSSTRPRRRMSTILQIIRGEKHPNNTLSPSIITNHPSSSESFTEHQKYGDKYTSIYEVPHATTAPSYPLQRSIESNSSNLTLPKYLRWNRKRLQWYSASNSLDNTSRTITHVVSKSMPHDEDKYYQDSSLLDGEENIAFLTFSDSYHDTTDSHEVDYSSRETQTSISSNSSIYSNDSSTDDTNDLEVCDALNVVMRYFCTSSLPKEKQSVPLEQNYPSLDQGDDDHVIVDNDDECVVDLRDDGFKGGKCTNDEQAHHQDVTDTHDDELERKDRQDEQESQESQDEQERQDRQDELEKQDSHDETKEATNKDIVTSLPNLESKEQIKTTNMHSRMNLLKRIRHSMTKWRRSRTK